LPKYLDPKTVLIYCPHPVDVKYNEHIIQMENITNKYAYVAHIIKVASFAFFKDRANGSALLDVAYTDKAQRAFGGQILCTHLLFAVDYCGWRSRLFLLQHRGVVFWKFGTQLRPSHGLVTLL
jgi:hypothetical protein